MKSFYNRGGFFALALLLASCTPQPTQEVSAEAQKGQKIFHRVCSNCHGPDAMGGHTKAPKLIDEEFIQANFPDEEVRETIIKGVNKMPSQRGKVSDDDIEEIIKYLRYAQNAAGLAAEDDMEEDEGVSFDEETAS